MNTLGESVSDYSIDFDRIKVEALDVMKLSKGGIVVPEAAIYYNDDDIEYDEDINVSLRDEKIVLPSTNKL